MKWHLGKRPNQERPRHAARQASVELLPGRLSMRVLENAWTTRKGEYAGCVVISEGLQIVAQKEIVFSFEWYPQDTGPGILSEFSQLITMIHEEACRGNLVDVGGVTSMRTEGGGFLASGDYGGILYTYPTPYFHPGPVFDRHLAAVLVKPSELDLAHHYGHTRVLAKLGYRHMFYPFPPFAERHRPPVFEPSDMEASLIPRTQWVHCFDSCVWADDIGMLGLESDRPGDLYWAPWKQGSVTLVLGLQTTRQLSQVIPQISHEHPLTLLTSVFPEVKQCLVYFPPPTEARVIHDAHFRETRCAGNFVMFGGAKQENAVSLFEDGFAFRLVEEDLEKLLRALECGHPFALPASPSFPGFRLIHRD